MQLVHRQYDLAYIRSSVEVGQWWRIITGQLVHNNDTHLVRNLVALLIIYLGVIDLLSLRRFLILLGCCCLLTGLSIHVLLPSYRYYLGLSAALHGMVSIAAIRMVVTSGLRSWGWLLFGLLVAKLLHDEFYQESVRSLALQIGIPVAVEAHVIGVVSGVIVGASVLLLSWLRCGWIGTRGIKNK